MSERLPQTYIDESSADEDGQVHLQMSQIDSHDGQLNLTRLGEDGKKRLQQEMERMCVKEEKEKKREQGKGRKG